MNNLTGTTSSARTFLFVPGDRPERFAKAVAAGAGMVVLDLEDAVGPEEKQTARGHVVRALQDGLRAAVRLNAIGTHWHAEDLEALDDLSCVAMVPKAEDPTALAVIAERRPVIALVETARGILASTELAAVPGVARLAFGSFDLAAELGVSPDDRDAMAPARGALVLASSAAGIAQPIDGVTGDIHDGTSLADDVGYARRLGFGAKLCIHPDQVRGADLLLRPSPKELAWAGAIIKAVRDGRGGVVLVDGKMVDKPVIDRAQRLIDTGGPT